MNKHRIYKDICNRYGTDFFEGIVDRFVSINTYFDSSGPNLYLFINTVLTNKYSFDKMVKDDAWKYIFRNNKEIMEKEKQIEQYILFRKKYGYFQFMYNYIRLDILDLFDKNGPKKELYDIAIGAWNGEKLFQDNSWEKYYKTKKEKNIINFYLKNLDLCSYVFQYKNFNEIKEMFNDFGNPQKIFFDKVVTSSFFNDSSIDEKLKKSTIEFISKETKIDKNILKTFFKYNHNYYNFFDGYTDIVKGVDDIKLYFKVSGPTEDFYNKILFDDKYLSKFLLHVYKAKTFDIDFKFSKSILNYLYFSKKYGTFVDLLSLDSIELIELYFDSLGPKTNFFEKSLLMPQLFKKVYLYSDDWVNYYKPNKKVYEYILFCKKNDIIICENIILKDIQDIELYFDDNGPIEKLFLSLIDIKTYEKISKEKDFYKYYENIFKSFKLENNEKKKMLDYINSDLVRGNFIIFIYLVKELDINETNKISDIPNAKKLFNTFSVKQLLDITKYCLFTNDKSISILIEIIEKNKLTLFNFMYNLLFTDWNIIDFIKLLHTFNSNINLAEDIFNYCNYSKSISASMMEKIRKIFVFEDKEASRICHNINNLDEYKKLNIKKNNFIIKEEDSAEGLKYRIFYFLFNTIDLENLLSKYNYRNDKLDSLINSINNNEEKERLINIKIILEFIDIVNKETNVDVLKKYLTILNKMYKNDEKIFFDITSYGYLNREITRIMGLEIREKLTNFNSLLNNDKWNCFYSISECELEHDFIYDNIEFKRGRNVPIIELRGIPFLLLCHTLNAFGKGGKLSDFKNPRLIGSTHICLCALTDCHHELLMRFSDEIDKVKILFCDVPEENFVIGSECDIGSASARNDLDIKCDLPGNFRSVRKNVMHTYFHNEYVFYRDGLMPNGVLISGFRPTDAEIEAAVYLDVPLVKINRINYPLLNKLFKHPREKILKLFYNRPGHVGKGDIKEIMEQREELMKLINMIDNNNPDKIKFIRRFK